MCPDEWGCSSRPCVSAPGRGTSCARDGLSFSAVYPALPGSVAVVRRVLVEFVARVGASQAKIDSVELAVSEAATNVVVHAYSELAVPGEIEVAAALASGELCVIVADRGTGLRALPDAPGLGLGLALISQLADGVEFIRRAEGGLELRMRFVLDPPAA